MKNVLKTYILGSGRAEKKIESALLLHGSLFLKETIICVGNKDPKKYSENDDVIKNFINLYGRMPLSGEIGCSLIHEFAIKNFLTSRHNWALVLENDAEISDYDIQKLEKVIDEVRDLSVPLYICLGHSKVPRKFWSFHISPYRFYCKMQLAGITFGVNRRLNMKGTVAYLINKSAASIINNIPFGYLSDDYHRYLNNGVIVVHPKKALVYESLLYNSTIENLRDNRKFHGYGFWIKCFLRNYLYELMHNILFGYNERHKNLSIGKKLLADDKHPRF